MVRQVYSCRGRWVDLGALPHVSCVAVDGAQVTFLRHPHSPRSGACKADSSADT